MNVLSLDNVVVNVSPDLQNLVSGVVLEAVLAEGLAAARDAEEGAVVLLRVPVLLAHVKVVVADELEEPSAGQEREKVRKANSSVSPERARKGFVLGKGEETPPSLSLSLSLSLARDSRSLT